MIQVKNMKSRIIVSSEQKLEFAKLMVDEGYTTK